MAFVQWWIIILVCHQVLTDTISPKLDFTDDTVMVSNTSGVGVSQTDEDLEFQHTIVLSTKLKNNRALHSSDVDGGGTRYIRPVLRKKNDKRSQNVDISGEVPVVNGYQALQSTQIRSPDTRTKQKIYADAVFVNRNINPDGFDVYPENAADPRHWIPSTFYNNINWNNAEADKVVTYDLPIYSRRKRPQMAGFNRRVPEDGMKDFYCCKCKELQGKSSSTMKPNSYPWHYESTTKMKLDGKLEKLN